MNFSAWILAPGSGTLSPARELQQTAEACLSVWNLRRATLARHAGLERADACCSSASRPQLVQDGAMTILQHLRSRSLRSWLKALSEARFVRSLVALAARRGLPQLCHGVAGSKLVRIHRRCSKLLGIVRNCSKFNRLSCCVFTSTPSIARKVCSKFARRRSKLEHCCQFRLALLDSCKLLQYSRVRAEPERRRKLRQKRGLG